MERITSLQNPRVKRALRLHATRGRTLQNRIIVFGQRELSRALEANIEFEEIFFDERFESQSLEAIGELPLTAESFSLSPALFAKLQYGDRSDGVVGVASRPSTDLGVLSVESQGIVVVVQAIEKPGNLGAIVRTADACGVSAILLADPMTDFFHPNAIRASTGTVFGIPVGTGTTGEVQDWLKANGRTVYAAMLDGAVDYFESELGECIAIVLGNEATGLDEAWKRPEYKAVKLAMEGRADSLNVSVTASVMIFEAKRQQRLLGFC